MKEIHVILIIFMLFILYNYFFVYEGFEATAYTKSIKELLDSGKFNNVNISGNDLTLGSADKTIRGDCGDCRALVKDEKNWLSINYNNDYKAGVYVYSDMKLDPNKKFCIGDTCIDQNFLKSLVNAFNGTQNVFMYKYNKGFDYIGVHTDGTIHIKDSDDKDETKKQHGGWRFSFNPPPVNNLATCYGLSKDKNCLG